MNFRQTLSRFFAPFLNNHIWSSLIFLFVEMLSYIVIVVNTELFRRLMLVLEQGGPYDQILLYGSVMVALLIGIFTLQLLTYKHWVYAFVGWTRGVVKEYVYRYLRLDHEEVLKYGTGKMLSIVNSGKDSWATAIDMLVMWGIPILTGYIANLIFIGYVDSRLIPYVLVFTVLVLLWGHWVNTRTLEFRKKRKEAKDKSVGYVVKMIMEKFTILKHDKWNQEWDKLNGFINQYENWAIRTDWYLKLMFSGTRFISDSARVAMILILAWFVYDGTGSISSVAAVVISSNFISNYVIRIGDLYKNITKISEDYTKMWDVFDKTPSIEGYDTGDDFQIKKGGIELKNIDFSYKDGTQVLHDFSLDIPAGKKFALVGKSGNGKSTIIKLIMGFVRPQVGQVVIDDQDLSETSLKTYYKHVGYLSQEPAVFDGTVRENLVYGMDIEEDTTDDIVREALSNAQCDFVWDLENGLDTQIGEKGIKLSGGQRQRLALARLFLENPSIILLDEPTSALDSFSEAKISEALEELCKDKTLIVVAHRLQTVQSADTIVVIGPGGKILEQGNHQELVDQGGQYASMLDLQTGSIRE